MKKFWAWLLLSSNDPEKASLFIKSTLSAGATFVVFFTGLFHYNVGSSDISAVIDQIGNVVGVILMTISSIASLWGLIRKIFTTVNDTNKVITYGKTL